MTSISPRSFLQLLLQMLVVVAVIWFYQIEQMSGLFRLLPLIVGGFVVNAALPQRFRPLLFSALSIAGILVVIPPPSGLAIVIIGLGLIAICHLPVSFRLRVAMMLASAVGLILLRIQFVETGWSSLPTLILPVVGSLFMFRMIIYMYDLRHEEPDVTIWQRLSYFFMLPNVCFLLFPVVDYQTFKRTYYNTDAASIYQTGVWWMFRGVTHLLLYRIVYVHLVPSSAEVSGIWGVAEAMITTYALYLRISGQFHLIVGIMCLFGFNLPETNHLYYLASSATDYWRRINIYWKNFMTKIFYNNAFVRFKKYGVIRAVILSTAVVFIVTWALHAYQWLWLRGIYPVSVTDSMFWGLFGLFAIASVVNEIRNPKRRRTSGFSFKAALRHSLNVLATFTIIALLWSLWSSSSIGDFIGLMSHAGESSALDYLLFALLLAGLVGTGVLVQFVNHRKRDWKAPEIFARVRAWYPAFAGVALILIANPFVQTSMPERAISLVNSASSDRLNRADEEVLERGYYETLLEPTDYLSALWSSRNKRPPGWNEKLNDVGAARNQDDLLLNVLVPSVSTTWKEAEFSTNSWGMRDREYTLEKPSGTYRYVLLGASTEMGWGVDDDEVFEAVAEKQFNQMDAAPVQLEILNFSVASYTIIQTVKLLEEAVPPFRPDEIVVVAHGNYDRRLFDMFCRQIEAQVDLEYPVLNNIVRQAGLNGEQTRAEMLPLVRPFFDDMLEWGYGRVAEIARERNVNVTLLYVPSLAPSRNDDANYHLFEALAARHGFDLVDLRGAYDGHDPASLWIAPWDWHPNAAGHRLMGRALYDELVNRWTEDVILARTGE